MYTAGCAICCRSGSKRGKRRGVFGLLQRLRASETVFALPELKRRQFRECNAQEQFAAIPLSLSFAESALIAPGRQGRLKPFPLDAIILSVDGEATGRDLMNGRTENGYK